LPGLEVREPVEPGLALRSRRESLADLTLERPACRGEEVVFGAHAAIVAVRGMMFEGNICPK